MSAIITYRNMADTAVVTGSTSPRAGFPLANLMTRQLSSKWKAASGGSLFLDSFVGGSVNTRMVALLGHNAPPGTSISVYNTPDAGATWVLVGSSISTDLGVPDLPKSAFIALPGGQVFSKMKITFPAFASDFEAARLWVGDAIEVPYGANSDWGITTRERGNVDESAGLEVYPSAKPRGRELRMTFNPIDVEYAFGATESPTASNVPSFQDMHTYVGAIGEVIAMPRTGGVWPRRIGVYGRLSEDSLTIRHLAGPNYATEARVIEER